MENKEKQIEEMAREIAKRDCWLYDKCNRNPKHNCVSQDPEIMLESSKNYITIATWLVNEGYQKIDKDSVVLSIDEINEKQNEAWDRGIEYGKKIASKETAEKILNEVSKHYGGAWLVTLYKQFGVEIKE